MGSETQVEVDLGGEGVAQMHVRTYTVCHLPRAGMQMEVDLGGERAHSDPVCVLHSVLHTGV